MKGQMRELSITSELLEGIEAQARQHGARQVLAINLAVGERSGVADESLKFYFEELAKGTIAQGARLNVRSTPMRFHCRQCGRNYTPRGADFDCPNCRVAGQIVDDGSNLEIESIEIEVAK